MKRKVSTVPAKIWSYGARPPAENAPLFSEQLFSAHRYYNALIQIERERREEYRKARAAVADLAPLEERHKALADELEAARLSVKAARASARKRTATDPATKERIAALALTRKAAYAELKAARLRLKDDESLRLASADISARATAKVKEARAASKVYWGSYLLVEKAVEAARKSPMDPEFRRWRGEGRVGVQLHHEKFEDVLAGKSTMFRISLNAPRSDSRRAQKRLFGTVSLRAGSEGRAPVWVTLPIILHRMPPPGATLSWAWIKVTRIGSDSRYELQLTVESQHFAATCGKGVAAIDVGWRVLPSGDLRVGYLRDDQGKERELTLPARLLSGLDFADRLRSHQSLHFDAARAHWAAWLKAYQGELPEWLAEVRKVLPLWKSPSRMAKAVGQWIEESGQRDALEVLWEQWKADRLGARLDLFASPDVVAEFVKDKSDIFPTLFYMECWRRKNRHLYDWESHQRSKCLGRRKDLYRNFAAELSRTYETLVFEDMDHRSLNRNAKPEDTTYDYLHRIRNVASPGELRSICVSTLGKTRVVEECTKDSTRECDHCHHINDWPDEVRAELVVLTCASCHRSFDQDANAARVLLRRYFERFGAEGGAAPKEPRKPTPPAPVEPAPKKRSRSGAEVHEIAGP